MMTETGESIPQSEHNEHRMRRAYSWFGWTDKDRTNEVKFILLWIAFNAAYGSEPSGAEENQPSENQLIQNFLRAVLERDARRKIEKILWEKHPEQIRFILDNRYLFKLYWRWVRDPSGAYNWRKGFQSNKDRIRNALEQRDVRLVFGEVFRRLYELRNQVFHGGMAFAEGWTRTLLGDATRIMADVVPVVLEIMKADVDANPESRAWGKIAYPRVGGNPDWGVVHERFMQRDEECRDRIRGCRKNPDEWEFDAAGQKKENHSSLAGRD